MKRVKTSDMVITAVFSALIAAFSMLSVPMLFGVPLTFQTFIIALTGLTLGSVKGAVSVAVYIAVGALGLPVFSGFQGGIGAIFGMTGGFIFGFIPFVLLCGIGSSKKTRLLYSLMGLVICHFCGVLGFSLYSGSIINAFLTASLPYLIKDVISVVIAIPVSEKIKVITQKIN